MSKATGFTVTSLLPFRGRVEDIAVEASFGDIGGHIFVLVAATNGEHQAILQLEGLDC